MLFITSSMAVLGFASYASAHMIMASPKPYGNPNNSPLSATGSDFPCKNLVPDSTSNTIALGSTQPLTFIGGATHGGGSCQISITYDNPPTKNSVFKVIHSIEGGCPVRNNPGNIGDDASSPDPDTYSFTVPTNIPSGKATLAWTWFNKVGNREMYMNCATVDLTAASSKRSAEEDLIVGNITQLMERDQSAYNALPDMFVANVGNGCATLPTTDLLFPNPGDSVDKPGASPVFSTPTGTCQTATAGGSGSASTGEASAPAPTSAASAPASSPSSATAQSQGGVFATVPASSAPAATQAPVASSVAPAASSVTPAASAATVAASSAAPAAPVASAAASGAPASTASGTQTPGSACSSEGEWNCIGGTSFQRCASGAWSVVQAMAAGTTCTPGESATLDMQAARMKRSIRFSSEHIRRHLNARS